MDLGPLAGHSVLLTIYIYPYIFVYLYVNTFMHVFMKMSIPPYIRIQA